MNVAGRMGLTRRKRGMIHTLCMVSTAFLAAGVLTGAASLIAKEKKPSRLVTGIVSNEAYDPIAGAAVTLTDMQTGKKTALYTGTDGTYLFSGLETTREYEVQATHNGLSSRVRRVTTIDPRDRITLNLQIPPPKEDE